MQPETANPRFGGVGLVERPGQEQPTETFYTSAGLEPIGAIMDRLTIGAYPDRTFGTAAETVAAREREAEVLDDARELVLQKLAVLALVDDETGVQSRRAAEALRACPIPEPVYQVAQAFGSILTAIVYSVNRSDRARLARLLDDVLREAARIEPRLRAA